MTTQWMRHTGGDVLGTVQQFIGDLWTQAGLKNIFAPVRAPEATGVQPRLVDDPRLLTEVDPFEPLMTVNAATLISGLARVPQHAPFGAVVRPCEVRALNELARRGEFPREHVVMIGVDCLGTFSEEDYAWRVEKFGPERLTREALQFAPQGGVALYRDRLACQTCAGPMPEMADVSLGMLGLHTRQFILVTARDEAMGERLHLSAITDGAASPELIAQHEAMRATLIERRSRTRERIMRLLSNDLPQHISELKAHLADCAPCQQCLEACPLYAVEFSPHGNGHATERLSHWLAACVECGMCEQACPKHLPLTTIFERIRLELSAPA